MTDKINELLRRVEEFKPKAAAEIEDFRIKILGKKGELTALMERRDPAVFYSTDLCAKYFTCTEGGESRFILFDDAGSLRRKIQLGQDMGITAGFLMYPEVSDLLPELFAGRK